MKTNSFSWRVMFLSEHTDQSWIEVFGKEDDGRRNYCVISPRLTIVDSCLTLSEAKELTIELNQEEI